MTYVTLSPSRSLGKVLLIRWYLTVAGLLASLALATGAYLITPPKYMSAGAIVLVHPSKNGVNSLLSFDASLSTTALLLVQSMSGPQTALEIGLDPDREKLTVANGGLANGKLTDSGGPFVSIVAQTASPSKSTLAVTSAISRAQQELADLQGTLRVNSRNSITVETVLDVTPAKRVWDTTFRAVGVALAFGLLCTIVIICVIDRVAARRAANKRPNARPREGMSSADRSNRTAASEDPKAKDLVGPPSSSKYWTT